MSSRSLILCLLVFSLPFATACQEGQSAAASPDRSATATPAISSAAALQAGKPKPKPSASKPPATKPGVKALGRGPVAELVKLYEMASAALADDALAKKQAAALVEASKTRDAGALAQAANKLAQAKDIAAARLAFGEVSRVLIAHLSQLPEYKKTLHVFECPMAKGFRQWVQSSEEMMNPYMGKKMLKCGFEKKH